LVAGLLVPPADAEALAGALERVLGSAGLRSELGRAGRQRVAEEFEVGTITRELVRRFKGRAPRDRRRVHRLAPSPERRVLPERRFARV
jgi:hypothetical protein